MENIENIINIKHIIKTTEVVHSSALIDAGYSLTRDQKRILWLFLVNNHEGLGIEVDNDLGVMEFNIKAYSAFYKIESHEASRDINKALKDFNSKEVLFYIDGEGHADEKATDTYTWLSKKSYRPKRGTYIVYFNPYLVPYLKQMEEAVNPKLQELDKLTNPKHIRLYTKLLENIEAREALINVDWIINRFELPSTYERYSNFKQRFLTPSINKLIELDGMSSLKYVEIKDGKRVVSIKFTW